jgi:hypothetical protein
MEHWSNGSVEFCFPPGAMPRSRRGMRTQPRVSTLGSLSLKRRALKGRKEGLAWRSRNNVMLLANFQIDCLQHLPILQHLHYSMAPWLPCSVPQSKIRNPQFLYLPNLTVILETAMAFASICFAAFAGAAARLPGKFSIFSA